MNHAFIEHGRYPERADVICLLKKYGAEDIKYALDDYLSNCEGKDAKKELWKFFHDDGVAEAFLDNLLHPSDVQVEPEDPRIGEIKQFAYETCSFILNTKHIRDIKKLLLSHSMKDIKPALHEFVLVAPKKELESGLLNLETVIADRKKRGL